MKCRLCHSETCSLFCSDKKRSYFRCNDCQLIFVSSEDCVSISEEKKRYGLHDNTCDNKDYVRYLQTMVTELHRIPLTSPKVLDYGSGPEKVLTGLLHKRGVDCTAYDPLYDIVFEIQSSLFDIVILCEVIEHLRDIRKDAALITRVLKPEGYLLVRTELYHDDDDFLNWWYVQDPTHVNFFSLASLERFGVLLGRKIIYSNDKNLLFLSKE